MIDAPAAGQQYMTSELHHRLLARNTSMFSLSSFREQRFLDTMCPKMLKALSDAALEVQMHTSYTPLLKGPFLRAN